MFFTDCTQIDEETWNLYMEDAVDADPLKYMETLSNAGVDTWGIKDLLNGYAELQINEKLNILIFTHSGIQNFMQL